MATIVIILIIWGLFRKPKRKPVNQAVILRAQEKRRQEAIRAAKARERQIAAEEKNRQRREQAEADRAFYLLQLERVSEMLNVADAELAKIERQIEIDEATRSYDSEMRDSKKREAILKRIMQYENRIHSLESRLAKANYILQEV